MPRSAVLAFLFACYFCSVSAQSLYHFKYNFKDEKGTEYYNAFMVRFEDGTGFIRINYSDPASGEKYLVNMDIKEDYDVDEKTGITQVVDGNWGVHAVVKKSLFAGGEI